VDFTFCSHKTLTSREAGEPHAGAWAMLGAKAPKGKKTWFLMRLTVGWRRWQKETTMPCGAQGQRQGLSAKQHKEAPSSMEDMGEGSPQMQHAFWKITRPCRGGQSAEEECPPLVTMGTSMGFAVYSRNVGESGGPP
jgi:hypothetical protein